MRHLILALLIGSPAMAQDLPFAVGDTLVLVNTIDRWTGELAPNPLPDNERACLRVETISETDIWLRVEAGYFDMNSPPNPDFDSPTPMLMPTRAPVGTGTGWGGSDSLWAACEPPDPTGFTTVSTTCNLQRLYERVPDCSGRPLPPE